MTESQSDAQARVYEERAEEYDALIAAEDADGHLRAALAERVPTAARVVADVGGGTGRLARWVAAEATHVHVIDRAAPMLEVAGARLEADGHVGRFTLHCADARALPLGDGAVDVALAGWVFGHFRHWMPDGWRDAVDAAVSEMRRVTDDGPVAILETLGTGHETPRAHPGLDEYFAHLEAAHGMRRSWHRTDYVFESVDAAAVTMGAFFGDPLVETIRARGWSRVPECTALFVRSS